MNSLELFRASPSASDPGVRARLRNLPATDPTAVTA